MGREHEHQGRYPALSRPVLRSQGGHGRPRGELRSELARFGIETTIVVPDSFTRGTNHFANAGQPADAKTVAEYDVLYPDLLESVTQRLAEQAPEDAGVTEISDKISRIVALPDGTRPFRSHVDPADDGSEEVSAVADRVRGEFLTRIGLGDLLHPAARK